MDRREFLTGLAGAALSAPAFAADNIPQRAFGRTGEKVSAIGLGGYHIGVPKNPDEGVRIIRTAIDRGMTFMDNCWSYHDGESEIRMGKALRDGYRDKVFLMTKFDSRSRKGTAKQIDECLQRLQTDRVDLMQYHENIRMEDPDRFFAANGPLEALLEAKKAGKIRFIGFTGHKDPVVHLRMLDVAAQQGFRFDSCQMPVNVLDGSFRSFGQQVLPRLNKEGIASVAMKPLGGGHIIKSGAANAIECLHYALSQPASVVITGCDSMERLEQAFEAMRTFQPMSPAQISSLLERTRKFATTGRHEPFKTTPMYDGTVHHPEWMA